MLLRFLRSTRLSLWISLFATAIILLAWISILLILHNARDQNLASEVRQNVNLTRSLEEQVNRVLATTDQALMRLSDAMASGQLAPNDLVRFANETGLAPAILVQLSVIDASGHFVGSNLDPTAEKAGHVDLSQREHVRAHLDSGTGLPAPVDGLFIGKPVLGKVSNRWTVQLSRKVVNAQGVTLGVVVASLDPVYFEDVFQRVELGPGGSVTLVGSDLSVRARVVAGKSHGMGAILPNTSSAAREFAKGDGYYITASSLDQVERIIAFRKITRYPLFVTVASGVDDALANWRTTRYVMLTLTTLFSIAVVLAVALFITGVRRLERSNAALQASEAQAQSANRAKSEFLIAMSHELRTPLTSIRGFAELMEMRLDNPRFREQAGLIRKGAEYLNNLFTSILDLAKIEAGAMDIVPAPLPLRSFVSDICDFYRLSAQAKGLDLQVNIAPDVPETIVSDALRLKQILSNLLSNAIKFTVQGRVSLEVKQQQGRIVFEVTDTGPGIPAGMHEAIFERFRQGHAKISYEHGGTGIGLALSRDLAKLMGGTLVAIADIPEGACLVLELPLG